MPLQAVRRPLATATYAAATSEADDTAMLRRQLRGADMPKNRVLPPSVSAGTAVAIIRAG